MKTAIIGGGGRVGSNAAYALQCGNIVSEIQLVDVDQDLVEGEALDLLHGSSFAADQAISAGDYNTIADSEVICITAGSRRKPDESRLDLINRNVSIFKQILDQLRQANLRQDAIIFVVSNPVDILTRLAIEYLGWDPKRVMGLGTVLDTARFRSLIAQAHDLPPTQVQALILGEHGDSMVPVWSSATAAGMPLTKLMSVNEQNQMVERTRGSGAEVIRKKGGAGYAVGVSIAEVIHCIALNNKRVLPVSTQMNGQYDVREVCLSIPTVVGRDGVLGHHAPELWPKEANGLKQSGAALEQTWRQIG
jgi:L-lactate dehydrogenase